MASASLNAMNTIVLGVLALLRYQSKMDLHQNAAKALQAGKWPRKLGLILSDHDREWSLDLQGDLFRVSGLKLPKPEELPGSEREAIEERLESTLRLDDLLLSMFDVFLRERFSGTWATRRDELKAWITQKGKAPVAMATA